MSITEKRLSEIQARLDAVTGAPWTHDDDGVVNGPIYGTYISWESWPEDADFIAHARDDVPDLLAEVDLLRGKLADAWDEGFEAGEKDAFSHQTFNEPCIPNPYRKDQS